MKGDMVEKNSQNSMELLPHALPTDYYDFGSYVSKERIITFWHQIDEILKINPRRILEIGIGPRIACSFFKECGIEVVTADLNASLKPDIVADVRELASAVKDKSFDAVLCARVLHHIPFCDFEKSLRNLAIICHGEVVLTLPVDDFRLYFSFRVTSRRAMQFSIPLPLYLKRLALSARGEEHSYYAKLWKINSSSETRLDRVEEIIERHFYIKKSYPIAEDRSHHLFVLKKNGKFKSEG